MVGRFVTLRDRMTLFLLVGAAVVMSAQICIADEQTHPGDDGNPMGELQSWQDKPAATNIVSWNAYSRQFIDAPIVQLLVIPRTTKYRAQICQGDQTWTVESSHPTLDLGPAWPEVATKTFVLKCEWLDKNNKRLAGEQRVRVKAPDWQGLDEPDADWLAAADRNVAYLIAAAEKGKAPYREPGVPVWIWSAASATVTQEFDRDWIGGHPDGYPLGYPCITLGNYIDAFLAYAQRGGAQKQEALRLAKVCGQWALNHRQSPDAALSLFPFSTITKGEYSGGNEGDNVNLLRASWFGVSMVNLYRATGDKAYLEYARHIADVTMKFQKEDGGFPYRVNPLTGVVSEDYTPAAIEFVLLVDALAPFDFQAKRAIAAQRAVDWTLGYVCHTNNWMAAYEDVFPWPAYSNLSGFETQMLIRYLCQHKDDNPTYLPSACKLNRWLEDQFVVFSPASEAYVHPLKGLLRVKGPLVFEQYQCWLPMEGHTGFWILTLIELHKATGDSTHLDKAKAAANAICATQFEDGQFSTLGMRYYKNGEIVSDPETGFNWYNSNAAADRALYALAQYLWED
jgi:hypothetical protein